MQHIRKILIANRGEIALRIIRSAKQLQIPAVALYTIADLGNLFVKEADEAFLIRGNTVADTYLNGDKIIEIAKRAGANAVHPGYGFLSENADFAQKCIDNGLVWVGPSPAAMRLMANKNSATLFAASLGVPVIPAITGSISELAEASDKMGFPLIIKAVAGGGGRGMKIVHSKNELTAMLQTASREAVQYFSNNNLFISKYFINAKHIEVQVVGDNFGNVVHLFERDCSIQRRFQKIIEEAPAQSLSTSAKNALYEHALLLAREAKYNSVGTIEFLVDENQKHYFLEMNTRIQVEHPVTEMVTGIDLVKLQFDMAAGMPLPFKQADVKINGHAIECRICAEDFENNFAPSGGIISLHNYPLKAGLRVDSDVVGGIEVNAMYDSLLSKLIVHAANRNETRLFAVESLEAYALHGVDTNIPLLSEILKDEQFINNDCCTNFLEKNIVQLVTNVLQNKKHIQSHELAAAAILVWLNYKPLPENGQPNVWQLTGYWRELNNFQIDLLGNEYFVETKALINNSIEFVFGTDAFLLQNINVQANVLQFVYEGKNCLFQYSFHPQGGITLLYRGFNFYVEIKYLCCNTSNLITHGPETNNLTKNLTGIHAPIPGKLAKLNVRVGDEVEKGQVLAIIESMKTENQLLAAAPAKIEKVHIVEGSQVKARQLLFSFGPPNFEQQNLI